MAPGRAYGKPAFMLVYCILFFLLYATKFPRFLADFPASYTWSDLMIAYQSGYVRRGLIGEIAFLMDESIGACVVIATIVVASYVAVTVFFIRQAWRIGPWIGTFFLLSPATLMFPLLDPEAFGRKDALILLAFAASLTLAKLRRVRTAVALIVAVYAIANFVVDSAIFYAPMALFAAVSGRPDPLHRSRAVKVAALSASFVAAFSLLNLALNARLDPDNLTFYQHEIAAAWQARYPMAFQPNSAVEYIGMSVADGIELVLIDVSESPTFLIYLVCLLLAALPTLFLLPRIDRGRVSRWQLAGAALAVAWGFVPFVFAADWGRYVHLVGMQAFVVVGALPLRWETAPPRAVARAVVVAAIVAYAMTWKMRHFVGGGDSALRPGIVFTRF